MPNCVLFCLAGFMFLAACTGSPPQAELDPEGITDTLEFPSPVITRLADLPEARKPDTTFLTRSPPPGITRIPVRKGESRTYYTGSGEAPMEPPSRVNLPALKNNTGQLVLDPEGDPYILGTGGWSNFTNYNTEEGLPSGEVFATLLDRSGLLWIGTREGVSRYDGQSFITYTTEHGLAHNDVRCILEDRSGNLWFGGEGISRFDGYAFTTYGRDQGLAGDGAHVIIEDREGYIWFGGDQGLSRFDGKSFTSFPNITYTTWEGKTESIIRGLVEDRDGDLWLATNGGGVIRFDPGNGKYRAYGPEDGFTRPWVRGMHLDKAGHIWIGTFGAGVFRYKPEVDSFTNYTIADGLAGNVVQCIAEEENGDLWFGTNGTGLSRFDGERFTTFTTQQGLAGNRVWNVTDDGAGHLWIATRDGGLSRYDGPSFTRFTTEHGLGKNIIQSMAEDQTGRIWLGTQGYGVSLFDGHSFTHFTGAQGLGVGGNSILSIIEDRKGQVWLGTLCCGVSRYNGDSFTTFSREQGLPEQVVSSIYQDQYDNLWFGITGHGVSRFDGQSFTNYNFLQGLAGNMVSSMVEDEEGGLWFCTPGRGISRFDGEAFTNFSTAQGLIDNTVLSVTRDKTGNLWFSTKGGISFLSQAMIRESWGSEKEKNGKPALRKPFQMFKSFTSEEGLPGNSVQKVLELPGGKMVAGTKQAIVLFDPPTIPVGDFDSLKGVEIYNAARGFPFKDISGLYIDSKGIIWVTSSDNATALVRFDYGGVVKNENRPSIGLRKVQIRKEDVPWSTLDDRLQNEGADTLTVTAHYTEEARIYGKVLSQEARQAIQEKYQGVHFDQLSPVHSVPRGLSLPFRHNQVTIHFGSNELANPGLMDYQYKLEGYDQDWNPVTKSTSANFGNIREGRYTFLLRGRYTGPSTGEASEWTDPLVYSFRVRPPWYRTWWMIMGYGALAIGMFYLLYRWRTASLRKRARKLEQTVRERTAEVVAEKERSENLLLNILPAETAEELKQNGSAVAKDYGQVTVLFTDFKDFTKISERLTPKELVAEIDHCYQAFDRIMEEFNIEKIKTIGDAYMAAAGLPTPNKSNPVDAVHAAIAIRDFMEKYLTQRQAEGKEGFRIRIGLHTGPVIAGIVGIKKFSYDIWGDTVNLAARMESSGEVGKVNISHRTFEHLKDQPGFSFEPRGKIEAKHKGEVEMYFVERNRN